MGKIFRFRLVLVVCFMAASVLTVNAQQPGPGAGNNSAAVSKPERTSNKELKAEGKASRLRMEDQLRKLKKMQQGAETGRRIFRQLQQISKVKEGREKAQRQQAIRHSLELQRRNAITVFGQPTGFTRAPYVPAESRALKGGRMMSPSLASPVLVNGKTQDTVMTGDSYDLTFSFSPGYVSAVMNVYLDADNNGVVSAGDVPIIQNALLLDNGSNDLDPADGAYRYRIKKTDNLSHVTGNLLFEINDYNSTAVARVTVVPKRKVSLIQGTVDPPLAGILVRISTSYDLVYAVTDSAGKFSSWTNQIIPYNAYLTMYDLSGNSAGYLVPQSQQMQIAADTSTVTIKLTPATSFVEGYVKDYSGKAVPNATVSAYNSSYYVYDPYYPQYTYWTVTTKADSLGHYKIGLLGGNWVLSSRVDWTNEYLSGLTQSVLVPSTGTIQVDLSLPKSDASISGKVKLNSSGLGGMTVNANSNFLSNSVLSGADGNYSIPVFDAGPYSVGLSFNDGGYAADTSYRYPISPDTTGVDFTIGKVTGGVAGKITDSNTHAPVANAVVILSGYSYATVMTDDSGSYHAALHDGNYSISISAEGYLSFFDYSISVAGGIVTKSYQLSPIALVSGKVTDKNGAALPSAYVMLLDSYGSSWKTAYTDYNGEYYFNIQTPGNYKVEAQASGYTLQYYNGKNSFESADMINVTANSRISGIDFALDRGGIISGRITNKSGQPLTYAYVTVYDTGYYWASYGYTNDNGEYYAAGLNPGKYFVVASQSGYATTWYDGKTSFETADPVSVSLNATTSNINIVMLTGGALSGKVTNKTGSGISSAYINVYDTLQNYVAGGYSGSTGDYEITAIAPGERYAMAQASGYASQWYNNATSIQSADMLSIQEGEEKTGIDFNLHTGGSISGKVLDISGTPLQYATIYAEGVDNPNYGYGTSSYDGTYTITGIDPGSYFVEAYWGTYPTQWYDHKSDYAHADTVHTFEDSVTAGIDFDLSSYAGIYGYVVDNASLAGIPGLSVEAINMTDKIVSSTSTAADGSYQLFAYPANYRIRARSWSAPGYLMGYYNSKGTTFRPSQAGVIAISDSGATREADIRLSAIKTGPVLDDSRLVLNATNNGRFESGDSLSLNGKWPGSSSKGYLRGGSFILGASSNQGTFVFGTLGTSQSPLDWQPVWNFDKKTGTYSQTVGTFFSGGYDTTLYTPQLTVSQKFYSYVNTDYVILTYKVYYDGSLFGQNLQLNNVYLGDVLRFSVSPGRDVAVTTADSVVSVCDSADQNGVNIGLRSLQEQSAKLGWWKVSDDPSNESDLYNLLKTGTTGEQPGGASDYRVLVSSGPYTMNAGDSISFAVAIVAGMGVDSLVRASTEAAAKYKEILTAVKYPDNPSAAIPTSFRLYQNYPNPFNPSTNVRFDLKEASSVRLVVFNVLGQKVVEWNLGRMAPGAYERSINMDRHPSGVYFYSIVAITNSGERFAPVRKMVLIK